MAHYQEQYEQTDEYGKPIRQSVDEYGNPIHHTSTTGGYGTAGYGTAPTQAAGTYGGAPVVGTDTVREHHGLSGKLHRSGSSSASSSSSEDDGHGGRRKKGLKEKVKEKLPGHHDRSDQATSTTTPGGHYSADQHYEKKGIIEKIKEKLPGHHEHHHDHH